MTRPASGRFEGKTAFVTGGAAGIGREIAKALLAEGARVAICGRAGMSLDRARRDQSGDILVLEADVGSEHGVKEAIAQVGAAFGRLDVLVNNAGIDSFQDISDFSRDRFRAVMDVNVASVFTATAAALPLMQSANAPAVVTIGSIHGTLTTSGRADYVASKSALIGATRALAMDLAPHGVRINLVSPGAIETPMLLRGWAKKAPEIDPETLKARAGALHPSGRIGGPEDVANAVLFLASDEAGFITGTELMVDGGLSCKLAMTTLWDD